MLQYFQHIVRFKIFGLKKTILIVQPYHDYFNFQTELKLPK